MIPKIIHYCWLSDDPIPAKMQKYVESWKTILPDYEFIHWSFKNFNKSESIWVSQAFEMKKYAFAADYIRLYALYNYGGIYLDMDVEIVKPIDEFLVLDTILGYENGTSCGLEVAAFGVIKHSPWIKSCLDYYNTRKFINEDGSLNTQPMPGVIKRCLERNNIVIKSVSNLVEAKKVGINTIPIFPFDYFSPKNHVTGKIKKTKNTYMIHHFSGSWLPWYFRFEQKIWHTLGLRDMRIILRLINLIKFGTIRSNVTPIENIDNVR